MSIPPIFGTARLLDDPELRFSPQGVAVCKVRLAFNSRRKNQETGQWEDSETLYIDGAAFKETAENMAESLTRSTEVIVYGRVKTEQYTTRDGEKRSATKLMIDGIGPSLRWGPAKVNKMSRSSGDGRATFPAPGGGMDDLWATASTGSRSSGGNFEDEPPF